MEQTINLDLGARAAAGMNLNSPRARRGLGLRILDQIRRSKAGIVYHYAPLNGLSDHQLANGFKEVGTPRKCRCGECQAPTTRQRLTETRRGIDLSSRTFVCGNCE